MDFVVLQAIDQLRYADVHKVRRIGNESAETPKNRIQLTDDSVGLVLEQPREWNLNVEVLLDKAWIVTARSESQVSRFDLRRDFAKTEISVCNRCSERFSAVD